jgi:hypothetical protein
MKIYFIPFIFFTLSLNAQFLHPKLPYEKIVYPGLDPIFHETSYDAEMLSDSCDGYNQFKYPFKVNEIYHENLVFIPYLRSNPYGWVGSYIECRDIHDGSLKWQQRYDFKDGHTELIAHIYIEGTKLVAISHKEKTPFKKNILNKKLNNLLISKREYNIQDGRLLSNYHRPYDDAAAYTTSTAFIGRSGSSYIFREREHLRYVEYFTIGDQRYLKSCLLDHTGSLASKIDTLALQNIIFNFNLIQLHPDTLLHVEMNRSKRVLYFRHLSPDLKLYHETVSDSLPTTDPALLNFVKSSSDKSKMLFSNIYPSNLAWPRYFVEYFSIRKDGKLLKYTLDKASNEFECPIDWEGEGETITFLTRRLLADGETWKSTLQVYDLGPGEERKFIKEFVSTTRHREALPFSCTKIENDNLLCTFREISSEGYFTYLFDPHASAISWMLIPIQNLYRPSDVSDQTTDSSIDIFPNPTTDYCYIHFDQDFTGMMHICDIHGKEIIKSEVSSQRETNIDVSGWDAGIYFINFIDNNNTQNKSVSKKLVKIR